MSFLSTIIGLFGGFFSFFGKIFDYWKSTELINQGKVLSQAELAKDEININRQQTEILSQERTKADTLRKLKDGTFRTHVTINTSVESGIHRWKNTGSFICGLTDEINGIMLVATGVLITMVIFVLQIL